MTTGIQEEANALAPAMEEIFTTLHQHPELGRREVDTQKLILERLDALGIESAAIAGTGVVGILRGVLPGRTAALRADVDALPIREETGLSYASRVPGVMHACGHDFHAAALLGAAALLASRRERLPGTVKFFFQPDEEGEGGAERMVAAGCMEEPKVDAVFACHVDSTIPTGTVSLRPGPVCAASDQFAITLRGRGTHGAKPHLGSDVILAASQVVTALQSIPSRRTAPTEPVVVTVGTLHAGSAGNILPEEVRLTGILRTVGGESRERVRRDFRAIVGGTAAAMGAEAEMELTPSYPACRNDGAMTELCRRAAEKVVGEGNVRDADFSLGADDFGYFLDAAPGCYWNVGVRNEERGFTCPNHSPRFAADPGALPVAAAVHAQVVLDFLEGGV